MAELNTVHVITTSASRFIVSSGMVQVTMKRKKIIININLDASSWKALKEIVQKLIL